MSLSHDLIRMLERAPLEHHSERLRVRFVSMRPRPEPPLEPMAVSITVETEYRGQRYFARVTFGLDRVSTAGHEQYVVDHLVEALRQNGRARIAPEARD